MKRQTLRLRTWYPWAVLSLALLTSVIAGAQTIVPPIAEYRGKVQGQFELRNDSDAPMAVILEAHSFKVNPEGSMAYEPMSSDLQLEMGNTSFVIEPGGTHLVFYKAKVKSKSAWFVITSTMTRANKSPWLRPFTFVIPLPRNLNICPLCVPVGTLRRALPSRVGTSISPPRAAIENEIGTSQYKSSASR